MTTDGRGAGAPLDHTRQVTIDALCEHFANDAMTVEEFEARVDVAHRATSHDELRDLLADLPSGDLPAVAGSRHPAGRSGSQVAPLHHENESSYAVAIMGGSRRQGRWAPARVTNTIAIMGGVELDFREALLPPGITEVKVYTVMGGVEIIVPPELAVESRGIGVLGGFDHAGNDPPHPEHSAPVLRISGVALMGGVDIKVRHLGESPRDARRRRRQERRERRKALRERRDDRLMSDEVDRLSD